MDQSNWQGKTLAGAGFRERVLVQTRTELGALTCFQCPARTSDLCAGVPDEDIDDLASAATQMKLAPGETLILDGDAAEHAYVVTSGTMMLSRLGVDGRRQILSFLFVGDFVGLSSDSYYHFNAEAVTEAELCRFDRRWLEHLFAKHPEMEKRFRQLTAKIVEGSLDLIFTLGRRNAVERVASFLLYLQKVQHTDTRPQAATALPMTRQDIADYLGLTIETVSRALTKLKKEGVIQLPSLHTFTVRSAASLRDAAGLEEL